MMFRLASKLDTNQKKVPQNKPAPNHGCCGEAFCIVAYCGLVVEIPSLNCFFCSPSNVNQEIHGTPINKDDDVPFHFPSKGGFPKTRQPQLHQVHQHQSDFPGHFSSPKRVKPHTEATEAGSFLGAWSASVGKWGQEGRDTKSKERHPGGGDMAVGQNQ